MFKFIKKHAVAITVTVGLLLAVSLGITYFFPEKVAAGLTATGDFFKRIGSTAAGWFKRSADTVDTELPDVTVEPQPA